eukprot:1159789-Pelagomonas_calceolata.AAC.6
MAWNEDAYKSTRWVRASAKKSSPTWDSPQSLPIPVAAAKGSKRRCLPWRSVQSASWAILQLVSARRHSFGTVGGTARFSGVNHSQKAHAPVQVRAMLKVALKAFNFYVRAALRASRNICGFDMQQLYIVHKYSAVRHESNRESFFGKVNINK